MSIYQLNRELVFPDVNLADEDGLLAFGGDLSPERLLLAYQSGIFPWYSKGEPILWWCPNPRFVLFPEELKISKSMRQLLRNKAFKVTINTCFEKVMRSCGESKRVGQRGTWITDEMVDAYLELHKLGYAYSIEVWEKGNLVGGLYGILMDKVFFGESMFFKVSNASKFGFIVFVDKLKDDGIKLIDCQQKTDHLASLGAKEIPRNEFLQLLNNYIDF